MGEEGKAAPGLIDVGRLGAWLDDRGLEAGKDVVVEPVGDGQSNAMFSVRRGGAHWILRRPSRVALERANDGIRREYRVQNALDSTDVPHARTVALCDDHEVMGCTFFLMEAVDGFVPVQPMPAPYDTDVEAQRELAFALADALAALHAVDWRAVGLEGFGRPDDFHERQVSRWLGQLESYEGRKLDGIDEVGAWLRANKPSDFSPTIMHADYHMMNVMIAPGRPARVAAIVDWETATIGDPLLDLAGFVRIWCPVYPEPWPTEAELVGRYAEVTGRKIPDLRYYAALYHFRMTVLLEGIYQRSLKDPNRPDQTGMGDFALTNLGQAKDAIAKS